MEEKKGYILRSVSSARKYFSHYTRGVLCFVEIADYAWFCTALDVAQVMQLDLALVAKHEFEIVEFTHYT